ncbi:hypothetical protein BDR26DRAFT_865558, partial [Obelidium mucronatum]
INFLSSAEFVLFFLLQYAACGLSGTYKDSSLSHNHLHCLFKKAKAPRLLHSPRLSHYSNMNHFGFFSPGP